MLPNFFDVIFSFPTLIFTILLSIIIFYWLFVIIGALDLDIFDADVDIDIDGIFNTMGFAGAPLPIIISFLILFSWILSAIGSYLFISYLAESWLFMANIILLLASLYAGTYIAAIAMLPLRPLFRVHEVHAMHNLIGKECIVKTLQVSEDFGQASYDDGGAGLIISVYADIPNNLTKDSIAIIIEYNQDENSYLISKF
jgi:hypothetical protein